MRRDSTFYPCPLRPSSFILHPSPFTPQAAFVAFLALQIIAVITA